MALNPLIDSRDVRFILFEMLRIEELCNFSKYSDFDRETFEAILELAEQIAVEKVYPANREGDVQGCKYDPVTKEVATPDVFKAALAAVNEAGFVGLGNEPEFGGLGMPHVIANSCNEYFFAANSALYMYVLLSIGATNLVKEFSPKEIKRELVLEKMLTGQWGGTMCLTEVDAGSDVGALKTKAVKQKDGSYLITGQKIFISGGDSDLYENIIHPVLARIDGDPAGTKGISMFFVPKYHINEDGSLGEKNDVDCAGIEHKMGIKGSATASLSFGDNGNCRGYLMGESGKGMKMMFQMMNDERLQTSFQGLGLSSTAYMHAVTYSKNRAQMAHVKEMTNPDALPVPIIQHPDVRRMLLWMKSHVEAMRMLNYFVGLNIDLQHNADGDEAKEASALVEFLIPVCKAGNTDLGWLVTAEAIQVYGGYGYCSDYPVEQFARDVKILSLYEGTNGIQGIDLAMRKLLMNRGNYFYNVYKKRIRQTVENARGKVDGKYIEIVTNGVTKMDLVVEKMKEQMNSGKIIDIFVNATPLLKSIRMLTHAWLHLWSLTITVEKLNELTQTGRNIKDVVNENSEAAYYYGKVLSSRFFIGAEFKKYSGKIDYILDGEMAVTLAEDAVFTGAPEE